MEEIARPFRVCLTGAESTGKSELAKELARHFAAPWVPEYAREYAERVNRELSYMDVMPIARGQVELEQRISADATPKSTVPATAPPTASRQACCAFNWLAKSNTAVGTIAIVT